MVLYSAGMLQLYASNILIVILHRIYCVGPVIEYCIYFLKWHPLHEKVRLILQ